MCSARPFSLEIMNRQALEFRMRLSLDRSANAAVSACGVYVSVISARYGLRLLLIILS